MRLPALSLNVVAVLVLLVLAGVPLMADPVQWTVSVGGNGHWYELGVTSAKWSDAFAAANAANFNGAQGYLATVTSAAENSFVAQAIAANRPAWLGGSNRGPAGTPWTWRNGPEAGRPLTYTNWNPGEPNNLFGEEDRLELNWAVAGGWNDSNDGMLNPYVIEYSTVVPEPGSLILLILGLVPLAFRHKRQVTGDGMPPSR